MNLYPKKKKKVLKDGFLLVWYGGRVNIQYNELAQMVPPPLVRVRWKVTLWV